MDKKLDWKYIKKLLSAFLIIGGAFLLIEHLYVWGGFDVYDLLGHEWYAILMIIIGFLLNLKFKKKESYSGRIG